MWQNSRLLLVQQIGEKEIVSRVAILYTFNGNRHLQRGLEHPTRSQIQPRNCNVNVNNPRTLQKYLKYTYFRIINK